MALFEKLYCFKVFSVLKQMFRTSSDGYIKPPLLPPLFFKVIRELKKQSLSVEYKESLRVSHFSVGLFINYKP